VAMTNLVRTCANEMPGSEPSTLSASGAFLDDQPAPGQLNTDSLTFGFCATLSAFVGDAVTPTGRLSTRNVAQRYGAPVRKERHNERLSSTIRY
jgi:hypothetical protein